MFEKVLGAWKHHDLEEVVNDETTEQSKISVHPPSQLLQMLFPWREREREIWKEQEKIESEIWKKEDAERK